MFCLCAAQIVGWITSARRGCWGQAAVLGVLAGLSTALGLLLAWLVDSLGYGQSTLVAYQFARFNLTGGAAFYGSHPWHWYVTQGWPAVLGPHLLLVLWGAGHWVWVRCSGGTPPRREPDSALAHAQRLWLGTALLFTIPLSFVGHKEFRFLLPVLVPVLASVVLPVVRRVLAGPQPPQTGRAKLCRVLGVLALVAILALEMGVFMVVGGFHQRGPVLVTQQLNQLLPALAPTDGWAPPAAGDGQGQSGGRRPALGAHSAVWTNTRILWLTPCHGSPYWSHIGTGLRVPGRATPVRAQPWMRLLDCQPDAARTALGLPAAVPTERAQFFASGLDFLQNHIEALAPAAGSPDQGNIAGSALLHAWNWHPRWHQGLPDLAVLYTATAKAVCPWLDKHGYQVLSRAPFGPFWGDSPVERDALWVYGHPSAVAAVQAHATASVLMAELGKVPC